MKWSEAISQYISVCPTCLDKGNDLIWKSLKQIRVFGVLGPCHITLGEKQYYKCLTWSLIKNDSFFCHCQIVVCYWTWSVKGSLSKGGQRWRRAGRAVIFQETLFDLTSPTYHPPSTDGQDSKQTIQQWANLHDLWPEGSKAEPRSIKKKKKQVRVYPSNCCFKEVWNVQALCWLFKTYSIKSVLIEWFGTLYHGAVQSLLAVASITMSQITHNVPSPEWT